MRKGEAKNINEVISHLKKVIKKLEQNQGEPQNMDELFEQMDKTLANHIKTKGMVTAVRKMIKQTETKEVCFLCKQNTCKEQICTIKSNYDPEQLKQHDD